jgi:hypothetical protein
MKGSGKRVVLKLGVAAIAGSAMALALVAPGLAHKITYSTNVQLKIDSINETTDQYSGKVTSNKGACTVGRTITVAVSGAPVATAVSNVAGDWAVTGPKAPKNSDVSASTPVKILKKNKKHRHRCAAAATTRKATGP